MIQSAMATLRFDRAIRVLHLAVSAVSSPDDREACLHFAEYLDAATGQKVTSSVGVDQTALEFAETLLAFLPPEALE